MSVNDAIVVTRLSLFVRPVNKPFGPNTQMAADEEEELSL